MSKLGPVKGTTCEKERKDGYRLGVSVHEVCCVGHVDLVGAPAMDSHSLPEMIPAMRAR
jgi:hypothetical protein